MAISFNSALGIHEQALVLRGKRSEILANNIANLNTPQFKARDIDFQAVLQGQTRKHDNLDVRASHTGHLQPAAAFDFENELAYRVPHQSSLDGNTVDEQIENAAFARNALEHQASFQFLNGRFIGLMKALRGE